MTRGQNTKRWWLIAWLIAVIIFVVGAGLLAYAFTEPFLLETEYYEFSSPQVPEQFDGTSIVLLTDIHRGPFFSEERVGRVVDKANALEPDLVVLGGDYIYGDAEKYARSCFAQLSRLQARVGKFAILGNHDYDDLQPAPEILEAIQQAGLTLLDNTAVWVQQGGARIRLGGVSDYREGEPNLAPTLEGTSSDDFVVLLSHNPDYAEHLPPNCVDLMLSGHTHGGQVTFFGLFAPHLPSSYGQKYRTGLVTTASTTVIISNGIGTSTPLPIRFFARPQIVHITLHHAPAS